MKRGWVLCVPRDKYLLVEACPGDFVEALFVDRLKIVDVAELEEYTGGCLRQGERAAVMQSENDVLSIPALSAPLRGFPSLYRAIDHLLDFRQETLFALGSETSFDAFYSNFTRGNENFY